MNIYRCRLTKLYAKENVYWAVVVTQAPVPTSSHFKLLLWQEDLGGAAIEEPTPNQLPAPAP